MFQRLGNRKDKKLSNGKEIGQNDSASDRKSRKDESRRVFGFKCSPLIAGRTRMLADRLNVKIFAVAEHALEIACELMELMLKNPEQASLLLRHLTEYHTALRSIEKMDVFDQNMADIMRHEWQKRQREEAVAIRLVEKYFRRGVKPEDIEFYIDYGMKAWLQDNDKSRNGK